MEFDFSQEEKSLLEEVRQFIKKETTPELLKESHELELTYGGPLGREFIQKFAANGWLTPNWPREYGGLGASEMVTYMIRDELPYGGAPTWFVGAHMAGPSILRFGNDAMKEEFLLPIARGEIEFALGYSEPNAGSDLLSLMMRAEDKGDHFLVNGQKIYNTHSHIADYHWLAVRTDPDVPKHKGLSMMIVDLKSPGITIRPMITMAGSRTNEVYYEDVKVSKENLFGEINKGFKYLMAALDFERMWIFGNYRHLCEQLVDYTKETLV
ncbi:acyl-CoA dehydrogenase family protein, partial [Thermodesulfobacteriota bacterium]